MFPLWQVGARVVLAGALALASVQAGFEIADLTEAPEDGFRGFTKVWLDYGDNPITPEEWETYTPSAGYIKNTPRNPEFNAEETFSSPGLPEGEVLVETIDTYTWKFIAQTQSAMWPYNKRLFPGTLNAYQAAFATTTPPAGTVKFSSNEKNQEMIFWARENDSPSGAPIQRFFVTDAWGNRFIMGASGAATDEEIPALFEAAVLPSGWTKSTGYLDETLHLLPAYGDGDQAHFNLFRESSDNTFFQIAWGASGESLAGQIPGMPIWGGPSNDTLLGRSGDDNLIHGAEGDDTIIAKGQDDTIHGDAGIDTVMLEGRWAAYSVLACSENGTEVLLFGKGCQKTLHNVEFIQCKDRTISTAQLASPYPPIPTEYTFTHGIPPRLQWNENSGYCGETSFISAGLHFGQYCSQYTARSLASPGVNQANPNSQLLLGVNDSAAAERMRLAATPFENRRQRSAREFLEWVKRRTLAGEVAIIGVFNNGIILGEWTNRRGGDSSYDHIVPVLEWGSDRPLTEERYFPADVITFSDNGLFGPFGTPPVYPFLYSFRVKDFPGTRVQANNPRGPVYMLKDTPKSYAIAISGVLDPDGVTIPVKLSSDRNYETDIGSQSNTPPTPITMRLTATVTIPDQSVAYVLYRYDDFAKVPVSGFNAAAGDAVESWTIPPNSGPTFTVHYDGLTNETVVFRAVPASAP